jgi:hypothetical protein
MRKTLAAAIAAGAMSCVAGCASDHHVPPPPPTAAQIAATKAATDCLVQHARMYDDGKMHPRSLAKIIEPTCVAEFEREGVEGKRERRDEAVRAVLLERNQQRQYGAPALSQR